MGYEEPEVIKIAGLISGRVKNGNNLFRSNLMEGINTNDSLIRQIRIFFVGFQDRPCFNGEDEPLPNCDVHLGLLARGAREGTFVCQEKRMAVLVGAPVDATDGEPDPLGLLCICKSPPKLLLDMLKRNVIAKGKIEVF